MIRKKRWREINVGDILLSYGAPEEELSNIEYIAFNSLMERCSLVIYKTCDQIHNQFILVLCNTQRIYTLQKCKDLVWYTITNDIKA